MDLLIQVVLLVVGFVMLIKGANWFVDGASGIAAKFGIPQLVIGLTIVAMGTSAPEAAVSIAAALKGNAGITVGNVLGSNILNVFIILGVTAVITTLAVAKSTVKCEIPYMIGITVLFLFLGKTGGEITFIEGVILWGAFIAYLVYLFAMAKNNKEEEPEEKKESKVWKLLLFTVVGLVFIVLGSDVSVDAASAIAKTFGMSDRLIGLTIVALGTSLPELFTSVTAATKGKADIAIGNIVGSNIFNILFVVGTTALITPVAFEAKFIIDTAIVIASGVMLWLFVLPKKQLNRVAGVVMLCGYVAYFVYLIATQLLDKTPTP